MDDKGAEHFGRILFAVDNFTQPDGKIGISFVVLIIEECSTLRAKVYHQAERAFVIERYLLEVSYSTAESGKALQ
ncbi:hypothetical protein D3C84_1159400 [compost metagenome]